MVCPKCKSHIDNNINFCNYCGEKINKNDHEDQYNYSEIYSKETINEEEYIDSFIGKNTKKIKKSSFSLPALFFGPFYLIYRKLFTQGIIILLIIGLTLYYDSETASIVTIIINLFLGYKFHKLYLKFVEMKVEEITLSNPDKTQNEILEICRKKGQPLDSTYYATFLIIFFILLTTFLILKETIQRSNQKVSSNNIEDTETEEQIQNLAYRVPPKLKRSKYSSSENRTYFYYKNNTSCCINIYVKYSPQETAEYILREYYSKDNQNIEEETRNNIVLKKLTQVGNKEKYYLIENANYIYIIDIEDTNPSTNECREIEENFLNSLEMKQSQD